VIIIRILNNLNNRNYNRVSDSGRFQYNPFRKKPRRRRYFLALPIIGSIIVLLTLLWWWPSWFADISLQQQLYANKVGSSFTSIYFLNFWSPNFFFNKVALIGALIGSIIMSIPPDRTLITVLGTRLRFGKPSYLKSLIFWWTFGFFIFYLCGFLLNTNGNSFSWAAYLVESGQLNISGTIIFDAFNVLFSSFSRDYITIFLYSNLILPVISFIFVILIFRAILNIIKNTYLRKNDYYVVSNVFFIIGLAFGIWFFNMPAQALDGIGLIQVWSILIGFISFNLLGLIIYVTSRISYRRDQSRYSFLPGSLKKFGYVTFFVLILIVIPLFISIAPAININNNSVWIQQEWTKKFQREVDWTTDCAGLNAFETRPIENFTESTTSSDALMISQIRQFDQDFTVQYLAASIGTTYEGLADSDIVYINGKEYWVAPKTIRFTQITDPVQRSTELFDHVEGFLAMDTYSGNLINITQAFNISESYPIFFGESESTKYLQTIGTSPQAGMTGAYDSDILLGTEWTNQTNYKYKYTSQPDGTLSGLENFWKKINLGLIAYATGPLDNFLVNRNVKNRVSSILLPQIQIDPDCYLVFNIKEGKLYYAVSLYTSVNVGSYAQYPILRFLGVCLVDVVNGDLNFYQNPKLNTVSDPTYPLWKIYLSNNVYQWHAAPDWLKAQMRYPEALYKQQLNANYIYHVNNPTDWKSEVDFQETPSSSSDVYYIESDLGQGIEYVGLDLVEYKGRAATLLAGMYMVRHGDHLGQIIFYSTRYSDLNFIGPRSANETYNSEATQQISLIAGARNGNLLLYPLAKSLYYYIPTYSTSGALQQLKLAGFVEAFTRKVGYGANAQEAYNNLNITTITPTSNLSLSYNFDLEPAIHLPNDPAKFKISLQNTDLNYTAAPLNIRVNLTLYTNEEHNVNYTIIVPDYLYPLENSTYSFMDGGNLYRAYNYTLVNRDLNFGEGLILNGFISSSVGNIIIYAKWSLYVNSESIYASPETILYVYQ
jgi:hypothetical protein